MVFVDECHATGFFGATGRGTEEYLGVDRNRIHIINSTLGKALGGAAGSFGFKLGLLNLGWRGQAGYSTSRLI